MEEVTVEESPPPTKPSSSSVDENPPHMETEFSRQEPSPPEKEIFRAMEIVERDSAAIADSFASLFSSLRLALSEVTSTSVENMQCFSDIVGSIQESALDASTKGNRYINSCLSVVANSAPQASRNKQPWRTNDQHPKVCKWRTNDQHPKVWDLDSSLDMVQRLTLRSCPRDLEEHVQYCIKFCTDIHVISFI